MIESRPHEEGGEDDASGRDVADNDSARVSPQVANETTDPTVPGTKQHTIYHELLSGSLNRFEAERLGDHALNSTISELNAKVVKIARRWERVPTRFGRDVRVLRYWIPRGVSK